MIYAIFVCLYSGLPVNVGRYLPAGFALRPKADEVKAKVDDNVYGIIDSKWKDSFGSRNNYRVNDVNQSPGDIQTDKTISAGGF